MQSARHAALVLGFVLLAAPGCAAVEPLLRRDGDVDTPTPRPAEQPGGPGGSQAGTDRPEPLQVRWVSTKAHGVSVRRREPGAREISRDALILYEGASFGIGFSMDAAQRKTAVREFKLGPSLEQLHRALDNQVPRAFSGTLTLDMEAVRPSARLDTMNRGDLPDAEYEEFAAAYLISHIRLAQRLRPQAKVGLWDFPYWDPANPAKMEEVNASRPTADVVAQVQVFMPSLPYKVYASVDDARVDVRRLRDHCVRLNPYTEIMPYMGRYEDRRQLRIILEAARLEGIRTVHCWTNAMTNADAAAHDRYLAEVLEPVLREVNGG